MAGGFIKASKPLNQNGIQKLAKPGPPALAGAAVSG